MKYIYSDQSSVASVRVWLDAPAGIVMGSIVFAIWEWENGTTLLINPDSHILTEVQTNGIVKFEFPMKPRTMYSIVRQANHPEDTCSHIIGGGTIQQQDKENDCSNNLLSL